MEVSTAPRSTGPAYTTSGYIVIDRRYGDSKTDLWSVIAHEIFHVLQDAHNVGGRLAGGSWHWFTEASAKWAQQSFVPDARPGWTYPRFQQFQGALVGLTSTESENPYRSFVWPYFIEQKAGYRKVGDIWRAMEGKVGWEQLNVAMTGVFSFEEHYKDFAVQALNSRLLPGDPAAPLLQVPDERFPQWSPQASSSALDEAKEFLLGSIEVPFSTSVTVPALAMRYFVFQPSGASKVTIDLSEIAPAQALDAEALVLIKDKGWERRHLSDGKTTFCLDRREDDLQRAILVLANHSWAPAEALAGTLTIDPDPKPCSEGTWIMDLINLEADEAYAGHYEGEGEVTCSKHAGKWLVSWSDPHARLHTPDDFSVEPSGLGVGIQGQTYAGEANWNMIGRFVTYQVDEAALPLTFSIVGDTGPPGIRIEIKGTCIFGGDFPY